MPFSLIETYDYEYFYQAESEKEEEEASKDQHKKILINKEVIINSINNVLNKKEYHENVQKMGKMLKDLKNPREEFKYWIDFGFNNGY